MVGSSKKQIESRIASGRFIPEEAQKPLRDRLRLTRLARNIHRTHLQGDISPGTILNYETRDISTMQMRHLYVLAEIYGVDFYEFVISLFDQSNTRLLSDRNRNISTMMRLMDLLKDEDQELACKLVDNLVDSRIPPGSKRKAYSNPG